MCCFAHLWSGISDGTPRVFELARAESASTFFALVAVGIVEVTARAGAANKPVSQEHLGLWVVELRLRLADELILLGEMLEERLACFMVSR